MRIICLADDSQEMSPYICQKKTTNKLFWMLSVAVVNEPLKYKKVWLSNFEQAFSAGCKHWKGSYKSQENLTVTFTL